ncbi:hypothetical protein [Marinovum sp.]|uniref:hypothetical protein n=1 Tax=Marinovum sp. TaxID=2024839 RepID=UPI003A902ED7
MTFTDESTKATLAKITAQNAARREEAYGLRHLANERLDCAPAKAPKAGDGSKPPKKDNKTNSTKSKGKTKFNERNITRIPTSDGRETYRVQIRRRVNGKPHSICESFQYLKNAKKWRDQKLAEIELHGFPVVNRHAILTPYRRPKMTPCLAHV